MADAETSIRFTTELEHLRVTDAPIQLPTRLSRAGLSEVVNHLLTDSLGASHVARPFDFLLQGELVRGSLGQALARHALSGEAVATLEYVECLPPPTPERTMAHDDWLGGLAAHPGGSRLVLAACYNHAAYVWDAAGHRLAELTGHTSAVKAVAWLRGDNGDDDNGGGAAMLRAASGSKDHTVRTWRLRVKSSSSSGKAKNGSNGGGSTSLESLQCESTLVGHTSSVESLAVSPSGEMLCSGASDGTVLLWNAGEAAAAFDSASSANAGPASKRAKKGGSGAIATTSAPAELQPSVKLMAGINTSAHQGPVNGLCWPTAALVYSGSWDGTLREWHAETGSVSATLAGQPAVLGLDVSLSSSLIASAHTDHTLRVWDLRLQQAALRLKLPHPGWVSDVKWCPHQPHLLASACYDGTVRLWDVRSSIPLHELQSHKGGKALCLAWDGAERLCSGGSDAQMAVAAIAPPGAA